MKQATLKTSEGFTYPPSHALSEYLRNAGEALAKESALLGHVITSILASNGHLTNKAIIGRLVTLLETSNDDGASEVIRNTLGIVLDRTIDDI